MRRISVGIIGTGWIGEIRARTCAAHPLVESLHLAEIDAARLARVAKETGAKTATTDYRELLRRPGLDAIIVSTSPKTNRRRADDLALETDPFNLGVAEETGLPASRKFRRRQGQRRLFFEGRRQQFTTGGRWA